MSTYCKYYKQKKQVSYDGGDVWQDVYPAEYRKGDLYAQYSNDCDYEDDTNYFTIYSIGGDLNLNIYIYKSSPGQYQDNEFLIYQYKINDGEWIQRSAVVNAGLNNIILNSGDTLKIRSIKWNYPHLGNIEKHLVIYTDLQNYYGVSGDVSTLTTSYFDQMSGQTIGNLSYLFQGQSNLVDASNLVITDVVNKTSGCTGMFKGCTSLSGVPSYSSSTIGNLAFARMFENCASLTSVPSNYLSATTLGYGCYGSMFAGCTSLTAAPELPSTTLSYGCYNGMFKGCTSLVTAPALPATTLASDCYDGMFSGCTSLVTAPELPATTLAATCYSHMFEDCSNLKEIRCNATDISAGFCTTGWVAGVPHSSSNYGTFYKHPLMTDWTRGSDGIPYNWVIEAFPSDQHRTISGTPYCNVYDKYVDVYYQVSYDSGSTWITTATTPVFIEANSEYCGYVPPTPGEYFVRCTYASGTVQYNCDAASETSSAITENLIDGENLNSIDVGECCTGISYSAFDNNGSYEFNSLTSVTIGNNVTTIGRFAFYDCTAIETIDIGSGITSIGSNMLHSGNSFVSLTVRATTPPTLEYQLGTNFPSNFRIYVPAESVNLYKSAPIWANYADKILAIT